MVEDVVSLIKIDNIDYEVDRRIITKVTEKANDGIMWMKGFIRRWKNSRR